MKDNLAAAQEKYQENKKTGNYGGVPVLTAAAFDEYEKAFWVASGSQIMRLDSSGNATWIGKLILPDGRPLQATGLLLDRNVFQASSYLSGIYEYPKLQ